MACSSRCGWSRCRPHAPLRVGQRTHPPDRQPATRPRAPLGTCTTVPLNNTPRTAPLGHSFNRPATHTPVYRPGFSSTEHTDELFDLRTGPRVRVLAPAGVAPAGVAGPADGRPGLSPVGFLGRPRVKTQHPLDQLRRHVSRSKTPQTLPPGQFRATTFPTETRAGTPRKHPLPTA